jgi:hypothetical protein
MFWKVIKRKISLKYMQDVNDREIIILKIPINIFDSLTKMALV